MSAAPPDPVLESSSTPDILSLHGVFLALRVPHFGDKPGCVGSSSLPAQTFTPKAPLGNDHQEPEASRACATSVGVLILGPAGIGKSELALELISRGHALVADDAPVFIPAADGRWLGRCPFPLQDLLEVRGLGILNVRHLFGEQAVRAEHPLDLIIRLEDMPSRPEDRLAGAWRDCRLGDATLPELPLTIRGGRNLALLVETAARLQACGAEDGIGYNAAHELSRRLGKHLGKESL